MGYFGSFFDASTGMNEAIATKLDKGYLANYQSASDGCIQ
jgi:hypothetical protein